MIPELRNRFRASFIMSDAPIPIASVQDLLADVRSRPAWDGASISPVDAQSPWPARGLARRQRIRLQCYEDEETWSNFLVTSCHFSTPPVEVELGGQTLERWRRELFVSADHAARALNHFLEHGKQEPTLE